MNRSFEATAVSGVASSRSLIPQTASNHRRGNSLSRDSDDQTLDLLSNNRRTTRSPRYVALRSPCLLSPKTPTAKRVWVWGTPVEMKVYGEKISILYLDTEGFESIGKSNVYDDRIFALAAVMSSVIIYNLPETIREAYISRLSFAVELAEEFYGRVKGQDVAFEPAKLLWLIQRDFLEGKSVQEMVKEALKKVPNANGDKYIDQVNQIRESLAIMGDNSTAFSLPQPHLHRTKLCDLNDTDLDPGYVEKREKLKDLVFSIARPKVVHGKLLNGREFVSYLNQKEFVPEPRPQLLQPSLLLCLR